jgi:hypothetical protein
MLGQVAINAIEARKCHEAACCGADGNQGRDDVRRDANRVELERVQDQGDKVVDGPVVSLGQTLVPHLDQQVSEVCEEAQRVSGAPQMG